MDTLLFFKIVYFYIKCNQGCIYSLSKIESRRFSLEQFCLEHYYTNPFIEHLKVMSRPLQHGRESKNKISIPQSM